MLERGAYSYHFVISQPHIPFSEYVNMSADGRSIEPVFGALFDGEDLPQDGKLAISDRPGFGLTLRDGLKLTRPFPAS